MVLLVLDINGVLGDVRKRSAPTVRHRVPDLTLPNGQPFYLRPSARYFMERCHSLGTVALWTARKEINARPIENYLEELGCLRPHDVRMHGEDCGLIVNFHPIKDVCALRLKYPQFKDEYVIFVDDSPENIMADPHSSLFPVHTYTAMKDTTLTGNDELLKVLRKIERIVNPY